jgi:hypothetical protein
MSIQMRLAALESEHRSLKQQINAEQTYPSCDDLKVGELKRCKLAVKDEIASVQQNANAVASGLRAVRTKKKAAACRRAKKKSSGWYERATQSIAIRKNLS